MFTNASSPLISRAVRAVENCVISPPALAVNNVLLSAEHASRVTSDISLSTRARRIDVSVLSDVFMSSALKRSRAYVYHRAANLER